MKKRSFGLIFLVAIILLGMGVAVAGEIMPLADSEFYVAFPMLGADKTVTFSARTYGNKSSISVTSCRLEEKVSEYTWMGISVPAPSYVATNTFGYTATKDYSAYIDSGTYIFYATFDADGHAITRSSGERTF